MTYNVFGGTLSLPQSINVTAHRASFPKKVMEQVPLLLFLSFLLPAV